MKSTGRERLCDPLPAVAPTGDHGGSADRRSVALEPCAMRTPLETAHRMTNSLHIGDHPQHRLHHLGAAALSAPELLSLVLGQPDALMRAGKLLAAARGSLRQLAQMERGKLSRF